MKTPEQADGLLRKFVQERDRKRRDALKRAATTDGRASPAAGADTNADDGANDAATADSTDADSAEESEAFVIDEYHDDVETQWEVPVRPSSPEQVYCEAEWHEKRDPRAMGLLKFESPRELSGRPADVVMVAPGAKSGRRSGESPPALAPGSPEEAMGLGPVAERKAECAHVGDTATLCAPPAPPAHEAVRAGAETHGGNASTDESRTDSARPASRGGSPVEEAYTGGQWQEQPAADAAEVSWTPSAYEARRSPDEGGADSARPASQGGSPEGYRDPVAMYMSTRKRLDAVGSAAGLQAPLVCAARRRDCEPLPTAEATKVRESTHAQGSSPRRRRRGLRLLPWMFTLIVPRESVVTARRI